MKKERRKLSLYKETIRTLENSNLYFVQGGEIIVGISHKTCANSGCHSCRSEGTCSRCETTPYTKTPDDPTPVTGV